MQLVIRMFDMMRYGGLTVYKEDGSGKGDNIFGDIVEHFIDIDKSSTGFKARNVEVMKTLFLLQLSKLDMSDEYRLLFKHLKSQIDKNNSLEVGYFGGIQVARNIMNVLYAIVLQ